jgi:hypothetical protein
MNETTNDVLTGHPAKLKSGDWGAHVNGQEVKPGDTVHIETKGGKEWNDVIERVVWKGTDSNGNPCALCTVKPHGKPKSESDKKRVPALPEPSDDDGAYEDDDLP